MEIRFPIAAQLKSDRRLDPRHVPKTQNIFTNHNMRHIVEIVKAIPEIFLLAMQDESMTADLSFPSLPDFSLVSIRGGSAFEF